MNWWLVYAVSVLDNADDLGGAVAFVGVVILLGLGIGAVVAEAEDAYCRAVLKRAWKALGAMVIGGIVFASLVPSTGSLLRAYLMVEGSKLVTAENAEKATGEIIKRIDRVIEQIGGR